MLRPGETPSRRIVIRGLPVFSGELLSADSPVFASLNTLSEYACFAKRLRGQFCIVVDDGTKTVAITDFGCSRPVFYMRDPAGAGYRVSTFLEDLIPHSRKRIANEALFFYTVRNGVGISPFYSDIQELFPGTVACFEGDRMESKQYLDWGQYLETRPIGPAEAERRLVDIASEYLGAIARGRGPIACLLSGGTDSALIAWLFKSLGLDFLSLTADYEWKRYSEFASASANARSLGIPLERVLVTSENRRDAFFALNGKRQNAPCNQQQAPMMYQLARYAEERGISTLATGDHADSLFLGFDRYFAGLPRGTGAYSRAIALLDTPGKLSRLSPKPRRQSERSGLLRALGGNEEECFAWQEEMYAQDRRVLSGWAERTPLHTLQQLNGQIWAGISWQNNFLPVINAFRDMEFVSPFYDIEMIKFALSLPVEYKFRDGTTKALLRDMMARVLGRSLVKRASPNPSRIWRLAPDARERILQPPSLRPVYDRWFRLNWLGVGRFWPELEKVAALGIWLSQQPLEI